MREVKFRAYYKLKDIMCSVERIDFDPFMVQVYYKDKNGKAKYKWLKYKECEVMQYTGLKDKNGVEIYEGDLYLNSYNSTSQVKLIEKDERIVSGHGSSERIILSGFLLEFVPDEIEIIGNIHAALK